jgi:hypothetical protein
MRRFIFAAAVAAVATMALAASASADVARYQTQAPATFTVTQPYGAVGQWLNLWTHDYTVTVNPCDGSFAGAGVQGNNVGDPETYTETITGTFGPASVSFTAVRSDGVFWTLTDAPFGGAVTLATVTPAVTWPVEMKVTAPVFTPTSDYKNHGDYVNQAKALGIPAKVAGPSCLGRPLPLSFTQSGTVDSRSQTGTTVTLPDEGTYRINVSGTWTNGPYGPVDAEFTSLVDPWVTYEDGFEHSPYLLGEGFGDVQVNGQFVNWGAYNASHEYTLFASLSGPEVVLSIFDGDSNTNTVMPWYGDNTGWLDYTITYVGP